MIIMGIDPGLAIVGYGVLSYQIPRIETLAYGAITTPAHTPVPRRLLQIREDLCRLIERYHPDEMAIEELFFNQNHTTAIPVAEARGVILMTAQEMGVRTYEYTPLQVKQAVVGYGRAEKKQVIAMTTIMLGLQKPPRLDDTADALAIAVCHAHSGSSRIRDYYNLS